MSDVKAAPKPSLDRWATEELRERRRGVARKFMKEAVTELPGGHTVSQFRQFDGGLEEMLELGLIDIKPMADRVLLRVVLPSDGAAAESAGGIHVGEQDLRQFILQQVVAVGPGCAAFWDAHKQEHLQPGDFVWVLSTVADRMSTKDWKTRLMTVRAEYIASKVILRG